MECYKKTIVALLALILFSNFVIPNDVLWNPVIEVKAEEIYENCIINEDDNGIAVKDVRENDNSDIDVLIVDNETYKNEKKSSDNNECVSGSSMLKSELSVSDNNSEDEFEEVSDNVIENEYEQEERVQPSASIQQIKKIGISPSLRGNASKKISGTITAVDKYGIQLDNSNVYYFVENTASNVNPDLLQKAEELFGERVICVIENNIITDIYSETVIDDDVLDSDGKNTIYAFSTDPNYVYEKNEYGTIKNVTFIIDGESYKPEDGVLHMDVDEYGHSLEVYADGFNDLNAIFTIPFKAGEQIGVRMYPNDGRDTTTYVKGRFKHIDLLGYYNDFGILLDDGKWYPVTADFSCRYEEYKNEMVKLTLVNGLVTSISKVYNATPYQEKNIKEYTKEEIVELTAKEYNDAFTNYLESIKEASEKSLKEINKDKKNAGQRLRELDENNVNGRYLTPQVFSNKDDVFIDKAYEGLALYLNEYVQKGVDLGKIDFNKSEIEISTSLVKKIRNSMEWDQFNTRIDGYYVDISVMKLFSVPTGYLTISKGTKIYKWQIVTNTTDTARILTTYINELSDQIKDANKYALQSIISELVSVTGFGEFTKGMLKEFLSDKIGTLQSIGCGSNVLRYALMLKDDYDISKSIINSVGTSDFSSSLSDASKVYKKIKDRNYSDNSVNNAYVNSAIDTLERASDRFGDALFDYIYDKDTFNEKWGERFDEGVIKAVINCPVDFEIRENGNLIGSYIAGAVYVSNENVDIEVYGDRKIVYFYNGISPEMTYIPTGNGTMDLIIESYEFGDPVGRLCFYDIELNEGFNYSQNIPLIGLSGSVEQCPIIDENGDLINADEYLSAEDDARVEVECKTVGNGTVVGTGEYVKGDSVTLIAIPEDGYTLEGWYENDNFVGIEGICKLVAKDTVLEARFKKKNRREKHPDLYPKTSKGTYDDIMGVFVYKNEEDPLSADVEFRTEGMDESKDNIRRILVEEWKYDKKIKSYFIDASEDDETGNLVFENLETLNDSDFMLYDSNNKYIGSIFYAYNYLEAMDITIDNDTVLNEDVTIKSLRVDGGTLKIDGCNVTIIENVKYGNSTCPIEFDNGSVCRVLEDVKESICVVNGEVYIYGNYEEINGEYVHPVEELSINTGKLFVNGDLYANKINISGGETYVKGNFKGSQISMQGNASYTYVYGDFICTNSSFSQQTELAGGIINVSGNIENINCSGNNEVILDGTKIQKLNNCKFSNLSIVNPLKKVMVEKKIYIEKLNTDCDFETLPEVNNDYILMEKCNLNGKNVEIEGNVQIKDAILAGAKVKIKDNLTILGNIDLSNGHLAVDGNILLKEGMLFVNKGEVEVKKDFSIESGLLVMQNEEDKLKVYGKFTLLGSSYFSGPSFYYKRGYFNTVTYNGITYKSISPNEGEKLAVLDGRIELYGDAEIYDLVKYKFSGTNKVFFNGNKVQHIFTGEPVFNEVIFKNSDVFIESIDCYLGKFGSDATLKADALMGIRLNTCDLNGYNVDLNTLFSAIEGKVDVNGGSLTTSGNLAINNSNSELFINGGNVKVGSELNIVYPGMITMDDTKDDLDVNVFNVRGYVYAYDNSGKMYIDKKGNPLNITAGKIRANCTDIDIKQDENVLIAADLFTITDDSSVYDEENYPYYGTLYAYGAIIDTLSIAKKIENYNIAPIPCWNNLIVGGEKKEESNENKGDTKHSSDATFDYTQYKHVKMEDAISSNGCIIAGKVKFDVSTYIQGAERFKSSDKKIASVSRKGFVKGKKSGEVTIIGQAKSGKTWVDIGTYTVHVIVPEIKKSNIKNMDVSDTISGNDIIINETLIPTSWKSSKPEVASVDETTGEIRIGSKRGTTKITAYYGSGKNAAKYKFKMRVKTSKSPSNNSSSQEGNSSVANVEAVAIF
ncbi:Ig-like domain (group 2) [Lachnospiraceae bacterium KH1T2]|nr:Ig-like domain (group 2) [Lachnospiraceae bacterium KH1T2]